MDTALLILAAWATVGTGTALLLGGITCIRNRQVPRDRKK